MHFGGLATRLEAAWEWLQREINQAARLEDPVALDAQQLNVDLNGGVRGQLCEQGQEVTGRGLVGRSDVMVYMADVQAGRHRTVCQTQIAASSAFMKVSHSSAASLIFLITTP